MVPERADPPYDGHTIDVGYVHVLEYPHGPCAAGCPHPDHDPRGKMGFIGPLAEWDLERCVLCGLDPLDASLHAPWCRVVTERLCGVQDPVGGLCLLPDHVPVGEDGRGELMPYKSASWAQWYEDHVYTDMSTLEPLADQLGERQ